MTRAPPHYVYIVACSFCLTFGSYFAVANQLSSILDREGFFLLSSLQGAFFAGTLLGPAVVGRLGNRIVFLCGAAGFTVFSLTLTLVILTSADGKTTAPYTPIVFVAAIICGLLASWMWVAQGSYVASLFTQDEQGSGFGKFNSIFSLNGVWGFMSLLLLDLSGASQALVFWIFTGTSAVGTLSFFAVRQWANSEGSEKDPQSTAAGKSSGRARKESTTLCEHARAMVSMFRYRDMLLQALAGMWAGNTEGMYWTTIAASYGSRTAIAVAFFTQSIVALGASALVGHLSDKFNRLVMMDFCLVVAIITNIATGFAVKMDPLDENVAILRWCLLVLGAAGFGISDFPAQAVVRANYVAMWRGDATKISASMGNLLCVLMFGTVAAALYGSYVDTWVSIGINSALAALSIAGQHLLPPSVNRRPHLQEEPLDTPSGAFRAALSPSSPAADMMVIL